MRDTDGAAVRFVQALRKVLRPDEFSGLCALARDGRMGFGEDAGDWGSSARGAVCPVVCLARIRRTEPKLVPSETGLIIASGETLPPDCLEDMLAAWRASGRRSDGDGFYEWLFDHREAVVAELASRAAR